jgi:hypothetical protein
MKISGRTSYIVGFLAMGLGVGLVIEAGWPFSLYGVGLAVVGAIIISLYIGGRK